MSYILDALKKSDRERKQGKTPSIYSEHDHHLGQNPVERNPRQRSKLIILSSLILATAVIFSTLVYKFNSGDNRTDIALIKPSTETNESPKRVDQVLTDQPTTPLKINSSVPKPLPFPQKEVEMQQVATVIESPTVISSEKQKILLQPPPTREIVSRLQPPAPDPMNGDAVPLDKLPQSLQAMIPNLKFAGHAYSDNPSRRMIIVNNSILKEGQSIDKATRLLEITWNGVIIEFEGKRILVETD